MRRIASKVHQQVARLVNAGLMKEPAWYKAVLDHPPIPLPPRTSPQRTSFDLPTPKRIESWYSVKDSSPPEKQHVNLKHIRPPQVLPKPIEYLEDRVRRQFFKDRPFEAFRARTLVEDGTIEEEHIISGKEWTRLRQRGRAPLPEDAVRFTVHLHTVHKKPLTLAYVEAVQQYDALRSEQHIMSRFALLEARAHGAQFSVGANRIDSDSPEVTRGFEMEGKALESWSETGDVGFGDMSSAGMHVARKRWKAVVEPPLMEGDGWSGGQDYIRAWKHGNWPDYEMRQPNEPVQPDEKPKDWKDTPTSTADTPTSSTTMYQ